MDEEVEMGRSLDKRAKREIRWELVMGNSERARATDCLLAVG